MVDLMPIFGWDRCVHPCDKIEAFLEQNGSASISLAEMIANRLVADCALLECHILKGIPSNLFQVLMSSALKTRKFEAIELLIAYWPYQSLSVSALFSWPFMNSQILFDLERFWTYTKNCGSITACLAQNFIKCLEKRRLFGQLKLLDLRGCISTSPIVKYLATYAVLSYNEHRQKVLQNAIDRARNRLSSYDVDIVGPMQQLGQLQETMEETTLLEGDFVVVADAVITDSTCFQELYKYREAIVGNGPEPVDQCLKLVFNRLDLLGLAVGQLNLFLNMVDPNHLIGLSLASNGLGADGLKQLAPVLLKFHALQALDLSHNAINFSSGTEICELLGTIARKLPNLQRLSLAGNPVGPRLRRIFRSVQPKFLYLSLAANTALSSMDLNYLKQHFGASLKELDLSGNALDNNEYHLMDLFETAAFPNLESLSLVDCHLSNPFFHEVAALICKNRRMMFLNLCRNHFSHSQFVENLPKFGASRTLQTLKLSFPFDCLAILLDDEAFDDAEISIVLNHFRIRWSQALALIGDHIGRRKPLDLLLC